MNKQGCVFYLSQPILVPNEQAGMLVLPNRTSAFYSLSRRNLFAVAPKSEIRNPQSEIPSHNLGFLRINARSAIYIFKRQMILVVTCLFLSKVVTFTTITSVDLTN
ncbi:MAG: hypothetical protein ACPGWR_25725 [Ardenticatenaceae bacterium]